MQLSQLKYFQAVCMFGSTMRASEVLYVSQPSVSSAITKLEQEFGVQLFDRSGNRMTLTNEGKLFLEKANLILADVNDLESAMFRLRNPNMIYISIPPVVNNFVPRLIHQYVERNPDIEMKIYEDIQEEILPLLNDNQRDLAITITDSISIDSFDITPLLATDLFFYTHKDNPLAAKPAVSIEDLAGVPLVMFKNNYQQTAILEERFRKVGIEPNVRLHAGQFSTVCACIQGGYASGCMIGKWQPIPDVVSLPFNPPLRINIGIIKKKSLANSKKIRALIEYLQTEFRSFD